MNYIPITIEGKEYKLFYANVDGKLLTRLEMTNDEIPQPERMPEGENVRNLIFATGLFGSNEALWKLKKILRKAVRNTFIPVRRTACIASMRRYGVCRGYWHTRKHPTLSVN